MSETTERKSRNCDASATNQTHKIGITWFIIAGILLISAFIVSFAETLFSISGLLWGAWSIFYWIGMIIGLFFILSLILGIYYYTRCGKIATTVKEAVSG